MEHSKELLSPAVNFEKVEEVKNSLAKSKCLDNLN